MVPEPAFRLFKEEIPVFPDDFSTLLNYRILGGGWERIAELTPELDARIRKSAALPVSFEEWIRALKTRQLTYTRVSRALLHLILDIQESDICRFKASGYAPYARILGFRKDSGPLLSRLKYSSCIPLITKLADAGKKLDKNALSMLEQEIRSAHIYQMIRHTKGGTFRNEYTQGVIISGTGPELQPCEPMSVS
ncbi:nucleotidyltransferase family protein, partial [[Clostridium] symbiosum]